MYLSPGNVPTARYVWKRTILCNRPLIYGLFGYMVKIWLLHRNGPFSQSQVPTGAAERESSDKVQGKHLLVKHAESQRPSGEAERGESEAEDNGHVRAMEKELEFERREAIQ